MREVCIVGIIIFSISEDQACYMTWSRLIAGEGNDTDPGHRQLLLLLLSAVTYPMFSLCQEMCFRNVISLSPLNSPFREVNVKLKSLSHV